jgi:hypothetical protein
MLPFDFNEYWLGVAFDSFKVHIELNISLTPSQPSNEITIPLLGDSGLDIPFMVSYALYGPTPFLPPFLFDRANTCKSLGASSPLILISIPRSMVGSIRPAPPVSHMGSTMWYVQKTSQEANVR